MRGGFTKGVDDWLNEVTSRPDKEHTMCDWRGMHFGAFLSRLAGLRACPSQLMSSWPNFLGPYLMGYKL
jgi:hypothetical protein